MLLIDCQLSCGAYKKKKTERVNVKQLRGTYMVYCYRALLYSYVCVRHLVNIKKNFI